MNALHRTLLGAFALLISSQTFAADAPPVESALTAWTQAVEKGTVEDILALYDKDAVMLSAFAIDPMTTQAQRRNYFAKVINEPNRKVDITKQDVRRFGDVASNTGLYMFHYTQDGEPMDLPARFTFVYVLKDGKWKIISHHSSIVPGAPKGF